ncbi:MAG: phosphopantetheine adenylyltransferase [Pseudomonadota bacterium]
MTFSLSYVVSAGLVVAGLVHLAPVAGCLGQAQLAALYGISVNGPDVEILLRHRAVLFGLSGVFMLFAAAKSELQWFALGAGLVSVISFLSIAIIVGGYNAAIGRVVMVDGVALLALVVASLAKYRLQ